MSALRKITVASLALGVQVSAAFAAGPPKLDVTATCSGAALMAGRDKKACLEDESAAKNILARKWSKFAADHAAQCVGIVNAGGPPSYVELLACLEAKETAQEFHGGDSIIQTDRPEQ
jgi:hypothetical protein